MSRELYYLSQEEMHIISEGGEEVVVEEMGEVGGITSHDVILNKFRSLFLRDFV